MKEGTLLFLRGQYPSFRPDRLDYDPEQFSETCEDMWTVLAERIAGIVGKGELWYWGVPNGITGHRIDVGDHFSDIRLLGGLERVVERSRRFSHIIARGGFKEYDKILASSDAQKTYYGAGIRFYPQADMFKSYNTVLVDTRIQLVKIQQLVMSGYMHGISYVIPKPAAPMFHPVDVEKGYDVCFPATDAEFKGHEDMFKALAGTDLRVLCIGTLGRTDELKRLAKKYKVKAHFPGWFRRKKLSKWYSKCRVGLVTTHKNRDSCPRVIPEMMACGLHVVLANHVNAPQEYCSPGIASRSPLGLLPVVLKSRAKSYGDMDVAGIYQKEFSIDVAAQKVVSVVFG